MIIIEIMRETPIVNALSVRWSEVECVGCLPLKTVVTPIEETLRSDTVLTYDYAPE